MLGHGFLIASDCVDETKLERANYNRDCPTVSHLPSYSTSSIYAFCHSSWVTTNTDQELTETITTFRRNDLFLYILTRTSTHLPKADTTGIDRFSIFNIWFHITWTGPEACI